LSSPEREAFEYTVKILEKLVSIPTVSPAGEHYEEAANLLAGELEGLGLRTRVVRVPGDYQERNCPRAGSAPRFIVLARMGGGSRVLHFNGHYDVVPGGSGWTVTEPFKPVVRDGRLYGRGACDMKGGIAAVLGALKLAQLRGDEPVTGLEVAFVPDEEIGGECGTGYLVGEVLERPPDYVVIPEPSGLGRPWNGHKGILWARVRVKGRSGHASMPWLSRNAFLTASRLALELQRTLAAIFSSRRSKYRFEPPEAAWPTVAIGGEACVPGGGKTNQIPGEFVFTIDRRLIPEETVEEALGELEAALRWASTSLGGVEYEVEVTNKSEAAANDPGELYQALKKAAATAGVELGEPVICPGGLDMHYYTSRGSKALAYGPECETAHAPDESVSLGELEKLVKIYHALAFRRESWEGL
jgi:succinyl-diaminopimelate desuccinylase